MNFKRQRVNIVQPTAAAEDTGASAPAASADGSAAAPAPIVLDARSEKLIDVLRANLRNKRGNGEYNKWKKTRGARKTAAAAKKAAAMDAASGTAAAAAAPAKGKLA